MYILADVTFDPVFAVDRNVNAEFKFNQETEFIPIAGLIEAEFNKSDKSSHTSASDISANHHSELLSLLSEELKIGSEAIHDFEL